MEYSKDGEKFAFGFGTDKLAGAGKISEAVPITDEKSGKKDTSLAGLIVQLAGAVGFVAIKVFFGMKKKNKKKNKKKKARRK